MAKNKRAKNANAEELVLAKRLHTFDRRYVPMSKKKITIDADCVVKVLTVTGTSPLLKISENS